MIEDDLWDHYSGLPNPKWYENNNNLNNEDMNDNVKDECDQYRSLLNDVIKLTSMVPNDMELGQKIRVWSRMVESLKHKS